MGVLTNFADISLVPIELQGALMLWPDAERFLWWIEWEREYLENRFTPWAIL